MVFLAVAMLPALADTAKVEVVVLDDAAGLPIEGVRVTGYFTVDIGWRAWTESSVPNKAEALTDKRGLCSVSGKTNCGKVGCWVENPPNGYYCPPRGWCHTYTNKNLFGVWQPDNLVATIRLQRVEHPIPLFVKKISDRNYPYGGRVFDKGNGVLEFDFLVGDWLPPAGRGKVADVRFERLPQKDLGTGMNASGMTGRVYRDSMSVRFLGADNGLVEIPHSLSAGLRIRMAPESGYLPTYSCWRGVGTDLQLASSYKEDRDFCFRIRTRRNEKGEIVAAHYGKIYGDISFAPEMDPFQAVASVCMVYYLNPKSLDRNLEWDMKTNLCPTAGKHESLQP